VLLKIFGLLLSQSQIMTTKFLEILFLISMKREPPEKRRARTHFTQALVQVNDIERCCAKTKARARRIVTLFFFSAQRIANYAAIR
jgi:hypothetical protein